jgi:hypothetical protein
MGNKLQVAHAEPGHDVCIGTGNKLPILPHAQTLSLAAGKNND